MSWGHRKNKNPKSEGAGWAEQGAEVPSESSLSTFS